MHAIDSPLAEADATLNTALWLQQHVLGIQPPASDDAQDPALHLATAEGEHPPAAAAAAGAAPSQGEATAAAVPQSRARQTAGGASSIVFG